MTPLPTSTSASKSSATTSSSTESCYKLNIMQRLGGENVFEFIVLGLVERLQQDETLKPFFANFGSSSLDSLQRSVLKAMFTKHTTDDEYDVDGFILLRYYSVIEQGFNETHFDIVMMKHFLESLEDAWVDDDVLQDAIQIVKSFRPIFVVHNVTTTTTTNNNNNINKNYLLEHQSTSQHKQQRRRTTTTSQEGDEHEEESNTERSKNTTETSSSSSEGDKKEAVTSTRRGSSGEYFLNLMRPRGAKRTRKAGVSQ